MLRGHIKLWTFSEFSAANCDKKFAGKEILISKNILSGIAKINIGFSTGKYYLGCSTSIAETTSPLNELSNSQRLSKNRSIAFSPVWETSRSQLNDSTLGGLFVCFSYRKITLYCSSSSKMFNAIWSFKL